MTTVHRSQILGQDDINIYTKTPTKVLIDVAEIEYRIYDLTTGSDVLIVGPTDALPYKFDTGSYYAAWTVPANQNVGDHRIDWTFKLTASSPAETFSESFDVHGVAASTSSDLYVSVQEVYDDGLPTSYAAVLVEERIRYAMAMIDRITQKTFKGVQSEVVYADGNGCEDLPLIKPIVSIDKVEFRESASSWTDVNLENFVFYDSQPADWSDPNIGINEYSDLDVGGEYSKFPRGRRNVRLTGMFGHCVDRNGSPPDDIKLATKLLCLSMINPVGTGQMGQDNRVNGLKRLDVDESEHEWHKGGSVGQFTGNPQVDRILAQYKGKKATVTVL